MRIQTSGRRLVVALASLILLGGLSAAPARRARAQSSDPAIAGQWSGVQAWPIRAIHMHLLPTGKVLFWTRYAEGPPYRYLWDPATAAFTSLVGPGYQEFCAGHSFLADGRLLIAGGHNTADGDGLPNASIYDPWANTWTRLPDMNLGRWYPTNVTLGNGEALTISGSYDSSYANNDLPQVWTGSAWRSLTGAVMSLPLYPDLHLAPNGRVFMAGPNQTTRYLDTAGAGAWTTVANRIFPNRDYGSSVLYDDGKILFVGGGDPPTATAEVIDLNAAAPAWRAVGSMSVARRQINATILADGKVLVTGGTSGAGFNNMGTPVYTAELWDPATETFQVMARMAVERWYHSSALLLPDGRVLSAGGDSRLSGEVYSPPYLFKGARPTISSVPAAVAYGQSFFVGTPSATSITRAHWIRLGSVTHANNMDQRINRLAFSQTSGGLNVVAPSDPNRCPPGHYLLFLLNSSGVPSVAPILRIGARPGTPTGLTATPGNAQVRLSWTASSGASSYRVKRATTSGGPYTVIATGLTATTYTNTGLANNTTYHYVVSAINAIGESANSNQASATPTDRGSIRREYWTGIGGTAVSAIPVGNPPSGTSTLTSLEGPTNWGDNYGTRIRGYLTAPATGSYTFWIAGDDNCELWISTNDQPAGKVRIADVPGWTSSREWNKYAQQKSAARTLTAGVRYYIEILHKEATGGDNVAVGWLKPGQSGTVPAEVIPGAQLSPF